MSLRGPAVAFHLYSRITTYFTFRAEVINHTPCSTYGGQQPLLVGHVTPDVGQTVAVIDTKIVYKLVYNFDSHCHPSIIGRNNLIFYMMTAHALHGSTLSMVKYQELASDAFFHCAGVNVFFMPRIA
jgi:hypothetical protein